MINKIQSSNFSSNNITKNNTPKVNSQQTNTIKQDTVSFSGKEDEQKKSSKNLLACLGLLALGTGIYFLTSGKKGGDAIEKSSQKASETLNKSGIKQQTEDIISNIKEFKPKMPFFGPKPATPLSKIDVNSLKLDESRLHEFGYGPKPNNKEQETINNIAENLKKAGKKNK